MWSIEKEVIPEIERAKPSGKLKAVIEQISSTGKVFIRFSNTLNSTIYPGLINTTNIDVSLHPPSSDF